MSACQYRCAQWHEKVQKHGLSFFAWAFPATTIHSSIYASTYTSSICFATRSPTGRNFLCLMKDFGSLVDEVGFIICGWNALMSSTGMNVSHLLSRRPQLRGRPGKAFSSSADVRLYILQAAHAALRYGAVLLRPTGLQVHDRAASRAASNQHGRRQPERRHRADPR